MTLNEVVRVLTSLTVRRQGGEFSTKSFMLVTRVAFTQLK